MCLFFLINDSATTEIYTLSLHDALPILPAARAAAARSGRELLPRPQRPRRADQRRRRRRRRSEEHTSELQSQSNLVCGLLLEKKKHHYTHEESALMPDLITLTLAVRRAV